MGILLCVALGAILEDTKGQSSAAHGGRWESAGRVENYDKPIYRIGLRVFNHERGVTR